MTVIIIRIIVVISVTAVNIECESNIDGDERYCFCLWFGFVRGVGWLFEQPGALEFEYPHSSHMEPECERTNLQDRVRIWQHMSGYMIARVSHGADRSIIFSLAC